MDSSSIESYKQDVIKQINKYRNQHGALSLSNDSKIDKIAQKFADQLSKKGQLDYSYNQYKGEDLGESVYKADNYMAPLKLVKALYDESEDYNYKDKDPEPSNFTQMVWKSSEYIGFGMQKSKGKYYFVLNYYPTGNIDGEFQKNVFPPGTKVSNKGNKNKENKENKENTNNNSPIKKENIKENYYEPISKLDFYNDVQESNNNTKLDYYNDVRESNNYNENNNSNKDKDNEITMTLKILSDLKSNIKEEKVNKNKKKKASSSSESSNYNYSEFCLEALKSHNKYRKIHHVEPLKLNKEICKISEDYAKKLANEIGHLEHSENIYEGDILGENLFYCCGVDPTGESVSKNWYGENRKFDYEGDWKKGTGHFTQMIWKETKEVGFGVYRNIKGQTYVVANYHPAGNVIGFFKYNVFEP